MRRKSLWTTDAEPTLFPALVEDLEVDVAVIGGGITGITAAMLCAKHGARVAVCEALTVGGGATGNSTGNLYATVDHHLHRVSAKYDRAVIGVVARSRAAAIDLIEAQVVARSLACRFQRVPFYLASEAAEDDAIIEHEHDAADHAGLDVHRLAGTEMPLPFATRRAIRIADQAQLNPLEYARGMANSLAGANCQIYEQTKVTGVDEPDEGGCVVTTERGPVIRARHVIMATHVPKGIAFVQTLLGPYREYGVAARLRGDEYPPPGIFWLLAGDGKYSLRSYRDEGGVPHVVCVGAPHKVGQRPDNEPLFAKLEDYLHRHFDVDSFECRWGAQAYRPADLLPYIGRRHARSNVFMATGFSADGLVYGTLAAMIISDEIAERDNAWAATYELARRAPLKAAAGFLRENANVALQYLKDWPRLVDRERFGDILPGDGAVVEIDGRKLAVHRDEHGKLHVVSAVCTHMACVVKFNHGERSWDCPCHGSRFGVDGKVIEGPAIADLRPLPASALVRALAAERKETPP